MIVVRLLLGIVGIVSFVWIAVGMPIGFIWLVIHLVSKGKKEFPWKKWAIVTGGGIAILPGVFVVYALIYTMARVAGVDTGIKLPVIVDATKYGENCVLDKQCDGVAGIDCNQAADGSYYFVDTNTQTVLVTCGGACMGGRCDMKKCSELHDKLQACN